MWVNLNKNVYLVFVTAHLEWLMMTISHFNYLNFAKVNWDCSIDMNCFDLFIDSFKIIELDCHCWFLESLKNLFKIWLNFNWCSFVLLVKLMINFISLKENNLAAKKQLLIAHRLYFLHRFFQFIILLVLIFRFQSIG